MFSRNTNIVFGIIIGICSVVLYVYGDGSKVAEKYAQSQQK